MSSILEEALALLIENKVQLRTKELQDELNALKERYAGLELFVNKCKQTKNLEYIEAKILYRVLTGRPVSVELSQEYLELSSSEFKAEKI